MGIIGRGLRRICLVALLLGAIGLPNRGQAQEVWLDLNVGSIGFVPFELTGGLRIESDQVGVHAYGGVWGLIVVGGSKFGLEAYAKIYNGDVFDLYAGMGAAVRVGMYSVSGTNAAVPTVNGVLGLRGGWLRLEIVPEFFGGGSNGPLILPTVRLALSIPLISGN